MSSEENKLVVKKDIPLTLDQYEEVLLQVIEHCNLPTNSIFVPVEERLKVFKNINDVVILINQQERTEAVYISKFVAAVSAGLFDAALNYLWDETIRQLRIRVAQYDIQYFYDLAVTTDKRNKLHDADDLNKLDDSELIKGAKEIDLITEIGYRHLDYIKYMRNWASAAHPNQVELTGMQLISWLETCIREVISLPISSITIEINKLLNNLKVTSIDQAEAERIGAFFCNLTNDKVNALASGFFGIYTRLDTSPQTRQNIHLLLPMLWVRISENLKNDFGIKYAKFSVNGDKDQAGLARGFLQIVNGEQYLPEPIRASEIQTALDNLRSAHYSFMDNFYKEPPFARQLERLVGTHGIPKQLDTNYVCTITEAFLTNGYGECWDAQTIYLSLIKRFNEKQAIISVFSFIYDSISSKLQFDRCVKKYKELLTILTPMITTPAALEVIEKINKYDNPLYNMKNDPAIMRQVEVLKKIL